MGSVADVIATGLRPPQVQTMTQATGEALSLANAMQARKLQTEQIKEAQLENQQRQMQLDQTRALNSAYQSSIVTNPDGTIDIDSGKLTNALGQAGHGAAIPSVLKSIQDYKKSSADLSKAQGEVADLQSNAAGSLGASVRQAKYDPNLFMTLAQHAVASKHVDAQAVAPLITQIQQAMQQDPTGDTARQLTQRITDQMIAASPKQRELDNAAAQAAARQEAADTGKKTAEAKLPGETAQSDQQVRSAAMAQLGAATNAPAYTRVYDQLDPALKKLVPAPELFDPVKTPAAVRQLGMTPEQQTQAAQAAANAAQTASHNKTTEAQGAARVGIEAGRLKVERERLGFDTSGGVDPAAVMAAQGKIDPTQLRMMIRSRPGLLAQIQKVDPNFDEANLDNRYNTLKEFTNTSAGKAGGQALALNTLIHHADLYQQTADALNNGTFRPGNAVYNAVSNAFGAAPPTNAALVARFFASETGKVATGGVPAEGEINGILKNLSNDASPQQISEAGRTLLQIAAGRAKPLMERAANAKIDKVVQVLGPDAQEILKRRGFDPNTMQTTGAPPPAGAAPKNPFRK